MKKDSWENYSLWCRQRGNANRNKNNTNRYKRCNTFLTWKHIFMNTVSSLFFTEYFRRKDKGACSEENRVLWKNGETMKKKKLRKDSQVCYYTDDFTKSKQIPNSFEKTNTEITRSLKPTVVVPRTAWSNEQCRQWGVRRIAGRGSDTTSLSCDRWLVATLLPKGGRADAVAGNRWKKGCGCCAVRSSREETAGKTAAIRA